MHHAQCGFASKLSDGVWRVAGVMAPAAWLLAGCGSSGGDLISTVALPSQQTTAYADGVDMPLAADAERVSGQPQLTPAQRDYLGALAAAGIHPANELRVLSIGAYVCQAHAAGQSDQAVWDSVAPMVRSDVVEASAAASQTQMPAAQMPTAQMPTAQMPTAMSADSVVSTVISIATGRLC